MIVKRYTSILNVCLTPFLGFVLLYSRNRVDKLALCLISCWCLWLFSTVFVEQSFGRTMLLVSFWRHSLRGNNNLTKLRSNGRTFPSLNFETLMRAIRAQFDPICISQSAEIDLKSALLQCALTRCTLIGTLPRSETHHFHSHRSGIAAEISLGSPMPLNCGGYLEDTFWNRKMTQMFSYIYTVIYRKSSYLHGPRHGVNIQCTMTMHDGTFGQICASVDHLQERHVRPFLTTALWSQLQAASEAPFGLCVWLSWNSDWVHFFPSSAATWSRVWNGMNVFFDDKALAKPWSKNTTVDLLN